MSRTTTATLDTAAGAGSYAPLAQVRIDKHAINQTAWATNLGHTTVDAAGLLDTFKPETAIYSPTISKEATLVCISATPSYMNAMVHTSSTKRTVRNTSSQIIYIVANSRPGFIDGYGWWVKNDGVTVERGTIDMSILQSGNDMVTAQETVATLGTAVTGAHIVGISATRCAGFMLDNGGIRFYVWDKPVATWNQYKSPGRLMSPENLFTLPHEVNDSFAVEFDNKIWFYMSDKFRGNVYGTYLDLDNFAWSDIFEVVQSDLSDTRVINAVVANSMVHLSVQFGRKEEWDTGQVYNLLLSSHSGRAFSLDRFTHYSSLGHRTNVLLDGLGNVWLASLNRTSTFTIHYPLSMTPDGVTILGTSIIEAGIESNQSGRVVIADADNSVSENPLVKKGARLTISFGYKTSAGSERIVYATGRVSGVQKDYVDPKSPVIVEFTGEAVFKLADLSSPFYAEIVGRTSKYDACEDLGNLYLAANSGISEQVITVDFWDAQAFTNDGEVTGADIISGGGPDITTAAGGHSLGFRTQEIKVNRSLKKHPECQAGGTFTAKLYGWCASTLAGTPNDTVRCIANIKDKDTGLEALVEGTLTSTYAVFPKNYNGTAAGSYPITWDIAANEGDGIVWIGFIFTNATGETTFLPESVELSNITAIDQTDSNTPWSEVTSEVESFVSEIELPTIGQAHTMFSTYPYDAWNFDIMTNMYSFGAGGGDGTSEYGLVGLAADANNMIYAKRDIETNDWKIVKVRDGVETALATVNDATFSDDVVMRFVHLDGKFFLYVTDFEEFIRPNPTWGNPLVTYEWQAADGAMVTDEFNRHVGIRAGVLPLKFRCAGFDIGDADGIPLAGNYDTNVLTLIATSGQVQVGDSVYSYTGVTQTNRPVGPYQGRSTFDWGSAVPYNNGNGTFTGVAHDMRWYAPELGRYAKQNYLCAAENGHTWLIAETEFDPWTRTGGSIIQLRNRSRHFSASAHGQLIGTRNRVCISPGLTGVALVEGGGSLHPYNTWVYSFIDRKIRCRMFRASDGLHDSTVRDMLAQVCEVSGAEAVFPGDIIIASQALTASTEEQIV